MNETEVPGTLSALLKDLARQPEAADLPASLAPGSGEKVGRFEVVREIGRGGFGVVLEARDPVVGRRVAVKLVRPGRSAERPGSPDFEEAEAVGRLSHPNVVQVFDAGTSDFGPYLVFELLRGEPLSKRLERGPLPPAEAARMALEVAKGLAHAHASAVVHRDLKPSNVFLGEDGQVKVLDFGLALVFGKRRTIEGGTPGWMAPEQRVGAPEDERTDVWALGAILFRALAGKDPAKARLEIPEVPELERLLERMLTPNPVKRPRDAREVVKALEPIVRGLEAAAAPVAVRVRRRVPRALRYAVPVVVVAGSIVVGLLLEDPISKLAGDDGRILTTVADIQNHTGDIELDALSGLLMTALEQSKLLKVVSRSRMFQVLRKLGREPVDRFDEPVTRDIGEELGARMLLAWSVQRFGDTYSIELKGLDPKKDEYLFSLEERVQGKANILEGIDRLSARTREKLRETTKGAPAGPTLATNAATTTNLEAYRHYFRALDLYWREIRVGEAREEARLALKADPEFAMAALFVAHVPGVSPEERRAALAPAVRNMDRLPEYERLLIRASQCHLDQACPDPEQEATYREAIRMNPERVEAYLRLGDLYYWKGWLEDALPLLEQAHRIDPSVVGAESATYLDVLYYELGRTAEGIAAAKRWFDLDPTSGSREGLGLALLYEGRIREGLAEYRRVYDGLSSVGKLARVHLIAGELEEAEAKARSSQGGAWLLGSVLLAQGRYREALDAFAKWRAETTDAPDLGRTIAYLRGDLDGVRMAVTSVDARTDDDQFDQAIDSAADLADLGAVDEATRLFEAVKARWPQDRCREANNWNTCDPNSVGRVAARIQFRQGDRAGGLARMREIAARRRGPPELTLGIYEADAGNDAEAVAALQSFDRAWYWNWFEKEARTPHSLFVQARSLERLGRLDEARTRIEELLRRWKRADPDLPMLIEAKALAKRVRARTQ